MRDFTISFKNLKKLGLIDRLCYKGNSVLHHGDSLNSTVNTLNFDIHFKSVTDAFSVFSNVSIGRKLSDVSILFDIDDIDEILLLTNGNFIHIDVNESLYTIYKENIELYYHLYNAMINNNGMFINNRSTLFYDTHSSNYIITFNNRHNFTVENVIKDNFSKIHIIDKFDKWLNDKVLYMAITTNKFAKIVNFENSRLSIRDKKLNSYDLLAELKFILIKDKLWELYNEFNEVK